MTTVVKSSENENKVIAGTLKRPCKSGRNHGKVHENGRGEVASVQVAISPLSTKPSFYLGMLVKIKLSKSEINLSFDGY